MNMADQQRRQFLQGELPATAQSPLERLSADLERNGYFPKLSKIPRAWQCTLFRDGGKSETPPSGRGNTALEALQAAAAKIGEKA